MKKKSPPQSSIGRWLNDEARHKDEPHQNHKEKQPKEPTSKARKKSVKIQ